MCYILSKLVLLTYCLTKRLRVSSQSGGVAFQKMKSKIFFHAAGILYTVAMLAITVVAAIRLYCTEGGLAGTLGLAAGLAATAIFAVGINTWVESWATDNASKLLCCISMGGILPMIIGLYGLCTTPTEITLGCLHIGAVIFTIPVFIAAIWGFILYVKYTLPLVIGR